MHAYLNVLNRDLQRQGCDFPWVDWQQGPYSRIPGFDPLWLLNHSHYRDQVEANGESAPIFSRYAGPGSQRYPVGFSGDAYTTWASLKFQPEFTATASNIGYGWWSHDIGVHVDGFRDDELTVRWVQSGVLSPIFRLHSTSSQWMSKEPWLYRPESEGVIRHFMQFRHRLVPYIYSLTGDGSNYLPLVQPLYWNFLKHDSAYKFATEYYLRSSMVVAPILQPRDTRTNLAKARVWVPLHRHVDILTGCVYGGDQEIDMYRPLHQFPIFAAEGSIIPLDGERVPPNGCPNPDRFEVVVVIGRDCRFSVRESNTDDKWPTANEKIRRNILIEYEQAVGRLTVTSSGRGWTFRFLATNIEPSSVRVLIDGTPSAQARCTTESTSLTPATVVHVPVVPDVSSIIAIELGSHPRLATADPIKALGDLLLDFQISYDLKDDVWKILQANQAITTKIARFSALDLDKDVLGPLIELLVGCDRK